MQSSAARWLSASFRKHWARLHRMVARSAGGSSGACSAAVYCATASAVRPAVYAALPAALASCQLPAAAAAAAIEAGLTHARLPAPNGEKGAGALAPTIGPPRIMNDHERAFTHERTTHDEQLTMAVREIAGSALDAELKAAKGALVVVDWCVRPHVLHACVRTHTQP